MNILKLFFLLMFISSCSSMSKKFMKTGSASINGGESNNFTWKSSLKLERASWFKEFTLLFDLYISKVESSSDFHRWFSPSTSKIIKNCNFFYIVMYYSNRSEIIKKSDFFNSLNGENIDLVKIPNFEKHLMIHGDFFRISGNKYEVAGLCSKKATNSINISFIGFKTLNIKP